MSDSHVLKITSGAELSESLDPSKEVIITRAEATIYEVAKHDNDDGTFEMRYKARITSPIELEQEGRAIRGADKKGKSKKLRGAIWYLSDTEGIVGAQEREDFYEVVMGKIITTLPDVWEFIKNK